MWHIWLIFAGVFFILEMMTAGFFVFWLGIGALLAMLVSLFTDNIIIQTSIFIVASSLLILFTNPLVNKFLGNKKNVSTNAFNIIGKKALVIEDINSIKGIGQIKLEGEVWSAKSIDGEFISKNSSVEIVSIEGVKACVKLVPTNQFSNMVNT